MILQQLEDKVMKNILIVIYLFIQYNTPMFTYNMVNGIIHLVNGSLK